ncbi:MAG: DUF3592 domain-containing protein, partial [Xanthobacteraceae bacterium]|nr:DUF3592 domain-containing protein [Xanthobacteraceae bacterium]
MNRTLTVIFSIFLAIGLAFAGGTAWAIRSTQAFIARAATAEGQVVSLEYGRDSSTSSSGRAYYPVVKYRTAT